MVKNLLIGKFNSASLWENIGRSALYLLGFLLPLWILPITISPLGINKVFLAYFLIFVSFAAWLIGQIKSGSITLPKNYLALALVLLVVVWSVAGVFSISSHVSFLELSSDPSGVVAILMFVLASFLAAFYLRTPQYIFTWLLGLFASSLFLFLFQILKVGLSINIFPWISLPFKTSNLFGSWVEFGIFFSIVGFIALYLFEVTQVKKFRIGFLAVALIALTSMIVVNTQIVWRVFFAFLLILLAYLFSRKLVGSNLFRPTFIIILLVLFFILAPSIASFIPSYLGTQPVEVRPTFAASWIVTKQALKENIILGSGPATFVYDWIRFKPIEVNQGPFWNIRFASGAAFLPSMLASTGLAGAAALIFLIASFFFYGFRVLMRLDKTKPDSLLILVFIVSTMLLVYSVLYSPGFVLTLFFFLFLGMFLGLSSSEPYMKEFKIKLFANSGTSFISALFIIFLLLVTFSGIYLFSQKYAAAYFVGKRVVALNQGRAVSTVETAFNRAVLLDERDEYYRGVVNARLRQMTLLVSDQTLTPEDLQASFQGLLSSAIQNAQRATQLNSIDPLNWQTLGRVYESVIPFQIAGVSDFAIAAYQEEAARNPTSPEPVLAQARIMISQGDGVQARKLLEEALRLKGNYTPVHLLLAGLEDQEGNIERAIERIRIAAVLSPNEVGTLFQLGLLYYRDNQLNNARQVFERAVSLNLNYSNARYFLGLIYDQLGDKSASLEQFKIIQTFNPGNAEVNRIIANLEADEKALEDISPPPEEREEAPVEE